MMTALATVIEITEERVTVGCQQQSSCQHCSSKNSCSTGIVSRAFPKKMHYWVFHTDKKLTVGQMVEIGLPEKALIASAMIVYLVPLLFLFVGATISELFLRPYFHLEEPITIIFSALLCYFGYRFVRWLSYRVEQKTEQQVMLIRVLGESII